MVYTGIVQQLGKAHYEDSSILCVETEESFWHDAKSGDSVCVDGVCLTLIEVPIERQGKFCVMAETRALTTLATCAESKHVNLERSLQYGQELGGHMISGHVNAKAKLVRIKQHDDSSWDLWLELSPGSHPAYPIVSKGSITLNGISLTVAELRAQGKLISNGFEETTPVQCRVSITPYTYSHTTIQFWHLGDLINVEYDQALQVKLTQTLSVPVLDPERLDEFYMAKAIQLGEQGRLSAPPNPWVGCVIVTGDGHTILGQGFHQQAGSPHAEVLAIQDAESRLFDLEKANPLHGATLYVTLEPCHHHGRTPPCDELLVRKKIKRVVIGYLDPDERVAGKGVAYLQQHNIEVRVNVCADQVQESLRAYLHQRKTRRPYCVAKAAISMDGKICCGDGSSQWITGELARADAHQSLRLYSQAILIGANTAVLDLPRLTVRTATGTEPSNPPLRVVVDSHGRVMSGPLMDTSHTPTVIFTSKNASEEAKRIWNSHNVSYIESELSTDGKPNLRFVLETLAQQYGVLQLLVEGGSILQGELLQLGLIDEFVLYQGSCMIGNRGKHWCNTSLCSTISNAHHWQLLETKQLGPDVRMRYRKLATSSSAEVRPATQPQARAKSVLSELSRAIEHFAQGGVVIVMDDENRENEGDFIVAAEHATPQILSMMVRYGTGIVCVPMTPERAQHLQLPLMSASNQDPKHTAFTVSCDSKMTTTGVSATDRATTITRLAAPEASHDEFTRPGHIFPLIARPGGLLERAGHTEAALELCKLAGKTPVAAICEICNDDGSMARLDQCRELAARLELPIISVQQLISYLASQQEPAPGIMSGSKAETGVTLQKKAECWLPLRQQNQDLGTWRLIAYEHQEASRTSIHTALVLGELPSAPGSILTRIHSECFTGDILGSARCDCGEQLEKSLQLIAQERQGLVIYMDGHEGRGIGLVNKLRAYSLMDSDPNLDTFQANLALGFQEDARSYDAARAILEDLQVSRIRLLSNNPDKFQALGSLVEQVVPLRATVLPSNAAYLKAKLARAQQSLPPQMSPQPDLELDEAQSTLAPGSLIHLSKESPLELPVLSNVARVRIGVISTMWNASLVNGLRTRTEAEWRAAGVAEQNLVRMQVPGAWELPFACAQMLRQHQDLDVLVCFGVLLKGETLHFEMISQAVSQALMKLQCKKHIPVIYGVLNCLTIEQAQARCGPESILPRSLACSALRMTALHCSA